MTNELNERQTKILMTIKDGSFEYNSNDSDQRILLHFLKTNGLINHFINKNKILNVILTPTGEQYLMNIEQNKLNVRQENINQNMLFFTIFVALITFIMAMSSLTPQYDFIWWILLIILFPLMLFNKKHIINRFSQNDSKYEFWYYLLIIVILFIIVTIIYFFVNYIPLFYCFLVMKMGLFYAILTFISIIVGLLVIIYVFIYLCKRTYNKNFESKTKNK